MFDMPSLTSSDWNSTPSAGSPTYTWNAQKIRSSFAVVLLRIPVEMVTAARPEEAAWKRTPTSGLPLLYVVPVMFRWSVWSYTCFDSGKSRAFTRVPADRSLAMIPSYSPRYGGRYRDTPDSDLWW